MKLSAIILTNNEENNIKKCLDSLPKDIELIVVDSGSTDRTIELAGKYGAKIFARKLDDFSFQRNFGLDKALNDWVLFIDADEELSSELKHNLEYLINNNDGIIGYDIRRWNYVLGKKMNHCWSPDYVLRLFNKNYARYEGELHEKAVPKGKVIRIEDPILHYTFQSISGYFDKVNKYSTVEAQRLYKAKIEFRWGILISRSWAMFTHVLTGKKGFLDGTRGLILAMMEAFQSFLTYAKLFELYEKNK
ncbi:MAG: glycosyltransferase family 2 protein [Candidatus Margulisiibacteriota bacterium]